MGKWSRVIMKFREITLFFCSFKDNPWNHENTIHHFTWKYVTSTRFSFVSHPPLTVFSLRPGCDRIVDVIALASNVFASVTINGRAVKPSAIPKEITITKLPTVIQATFKNVSAAFFTDSWECRVSVLSSLLPSEVSVSWLHPIRKCQSSRSRRITPTRWSVAIRKRQVWPTIPTSTMSNRSQSPLHRHLIRRYPAKVCVYHC